MNPTVKTFTEGTSSIGGDDVTLTSTLNLNDRRRGDQADRRRRHRRPVLREGHPRRRRAAGAGIAGGTVNSSNSPTVVTGVGSGTTVTATGDVNVMSNVFQLAETNGPLDRRGARRRRRDGRRDRDRERQHDDLLRRHAHRWCGQPHRPGRPSQRHSNSSGRAVGGAIVGAFTGPTIKAETKPTVATTARRHDHASGDIIAKSDVTTAAVAVGSAFTVSLLVAVAQVDVNATDSPIISTTVSAASITSTGGDITISALHNFPYPTSRPT